MELHDIKWKLILWIWFNVVINVKGAMEYLKTALLVKYKKEDIHQCQI